MYAKSSNMQQMSELNSSFSKAFEKLKVAVNEVAGESDNRAIYIDRACKNSSRALRHKKLLQYIRDVRNTLHHPQNRSEGSAFLVTEDFIQETLQIAGELANPPTAKNICVPRGSLFVADVGTQIGEIIKEMRTKGYSHVPILDSEGRVLGVFNESAVFDYFCSDDIVDSDPKLLIDQLMQHCRLEAGHTERFEFVGPSQNEDTILKKFLNVQNDKARVGAIFVTASGKPFDPMTGMITAWDVLEQSSDL